MIALRAGTPQPIDVSRGRSAGQVVANLGSDCRHNGSVDAGALDLSRMLGNHMDWRRRTSGGASTTSGAQQARSHQTLD